MFRETAVQQENMIESTEMVPKNAQGGRACFSLTKKLVKILSHHLCCSQYLTLMTAIPPILISFGLLANSQPRTLLKNL